MVGIGNSGVDYSIEMVSNNNPSSSESATLYDSDVSHFEIQ